MRTAGIVLVFLALAVGTAVAAGDARGTTLGAGCWRSDAANDMFTSP